MSRLLAGYRCVFRVTLQLWLTAISICILVPSAHSAIFKAEPTALTLSAALGKTSAKKTFKVTNTGRGTGRALITVNQRQFRVEPALCRLRSQRSCTIEVFLATH